MPSSRQSTKRKWTETDTAESDTTPSPAIERSAQFWFDDGNVVLQAEATQFRVHRSILSHHSSVMKDCFQCLQPEDAPTIEGCPLIHLQDSAKDIDNMCALPYGMHHVDVKTITSSVMATMLLMGRKYEITSFTTMAESILQQLFPPTLEEWDISQAEVKKIATRDQGFLFDLFNVVYEFPLPSIMRPLLISMCTIDELASESITSEVSDKAPLTPRAKQYYILGRMICMQLMPLFFMDLYRSMDSEYAIPVETCHSRSNCLSGMRDITAEMVMRSGPRSTLEFPSPVIRARAVSYAGAPNRLCPVCYEIFQEHLQISRLGLWEELPGALEVLKTP